MVFVADLVEPELADDDRRHLERSLRLRPGTPITVADGAGRWRKARLGTTVEPDGDIVVEPSPSPPLAIGFAPVKGDRSDLIVQKLTELAIDEIVPLLTERSVVRWDESRVVKNLGRHRKISREAAMQSRNPWLPTVKPLQTLDQFTASGSGATGSRGETVLADPDGEALDRTVDRIAIGPEGGFSPSELAGSRLAALPGRILRTETAAITAAVLLVNARRG